MHTVVKTTTSSIEIDPFGVVQNVFKTKSGFKLAYIIEQSNTIRQMLNGKKAPILVNVSKVDEITLRYYSRLISADNLESASALAVLVSSTLQKRMLNVWYRLHTRHCPIRAFSNEQEANIWLQQYVVASNNAQ